MPAHFSRPSAAPRASVAGAGSERSLAKTWLGPATPALPGTPLHGTEVEALRRELGRARYLLAWDTSDRRAAIGGWRPSAGSRS